MFHGHGFNEVVGTIQTVKNAGLTDELFDNYQMPIL